MKISRFLILVVWCALGCGGKAKRPVTPEAAETAEATDAGATDLPSAAGDTSDAGASAALSPDSPPAAAPAAAPPPDTLSCLVMETSCTEMKRGDASPAAPRQRCAT